MLGGSAPWRDFSQYRRLRPLWKALRGFAARSVTTVPLTWWSPVGIRLIHRESVIDDGLPALAHWFDPAVRSAAYEAARGQGLDGPAAAVVADAAMLAAAWQHRTAAERVCGDGAAGKAGRPGPGVRGVHRASYAGACGGVRGSRGPGRPARRRPARSAPAGRRWSSGRRRRARG
ncbi:DUF6545 domain-containing protein [Streptomyces sp. NPDC054865]